MRQCIVCGDPHLRPFLDLGATSLANKFLTREEIADQPEPVHPLVVGFCGGCGHVQLMDAIPPPAMFDDYLYISSMSDTLTAHLHDLAATLTARLRLGGDALVVDVGSNDGALLEGFAKHGVQTLGVDPARNLAARAAQKGVRTETAYFGLETAQRLRAEHGPAALITSTNSFPHIPDLRDFLAGVDALLADDGAFVIEAHYLRDLLEQNAFDTIYHEHVSYWALGPMKTALARVGLEPTQVERLPLHHGQIRVTIRRAGVAPVDARVPALLAEEAAIGLDRFETFERFAAKADEQRAALTTLLTRLKAEGRSVAGYGAPAKGSTLIAYLGVGPELIAYIADRSPLKQGRFTPGAHIPVVAPERLLDDQPDYVVLFAWNFADEIMAQQDAYRRRGGRFIIPIPEIAIV